MRLLRRDPAAAQDRDEVVGWRASRLRGAGLSSRLAGAIARDPAYDLHAILELRDRGCPAELAARIVAPIDGGPPVVTPPAANAAPAKRSTSVSGTVSARGASTLESNVDPESRKWIDRLRPESGDRDRAIEELHALLLKGASFEVRRRGAAFPQLRGGDHDDLAHQSADDALVAILGKLDDFRGDSRFTTWAYKFALFEAGVKVRRRAWQGRELPLEEEAWSVLSDAAPDPHEDAETSELLGALHEAIDADLSPHQREVLVAVTLNDVPIDVLAERLNTTRGALYKTIHDARAKLRGALARRGLEPERAAEGRS